MGPGDILVDHELLEDVEQHGGKLQYPAVSVYPAAEIEAPLVDAAEVVVEIRIGQYPACLAAPHAHAHDAYYDRKPQHQYHQKEHRQYCDQPLFGKAGEQRCQGAEEKHHYRAVQEVGGHIGHHPPPDVYVKGPEEGLRGEQRRKAHHHKENGSCDKAEHLAKKYPHAAVWLCDKNAQSAFVDFAGDKTGSDRAYYGHQDHAVGQEEDYKVLHHQHPAQEVVVYGGVVSCSGGPYDVSSGHSGCKSQQHGPELKRFLERSFQYHEHLFPPPSSVYKASRARVLPR